MGTVGACIAFTKTMSTGATVATFNVGGSFNRYFLMIPSMASNGDVRLNVSPDDSTYKALYHAPTVATATPTLFNIASSISNCVIEVPALSQYFQVAITTATTATAYQFTVICGA